MPRHSRFGDNKSRYRPYRSLYWDFFDMVRRQIACSTARVVDLPVTIVSDIVKTGSLLSICFRTSLCLAWGADRTLAPRLCQCLAPSCSTRIYSGHYGQPWWTITPSFVSGILCPKFVAQHCLAG